MPIRLRDSSAVVGRLRATTGDATASIAGTHVQPANVSGSVVSRLGDVVCSIAGTFDPAATRTGVIATTLQHCVAAEFGTSAPPPAPNRSGTIATTLAGVTGSVRGTFTPPVPPASSWFLNWPTMNVLILQGSINSHLLDSTQHEKLGDQDMYAWQGSNPTPGRLVSRKTNAQAIRALQVASGGAQRTRFGQYMSFQQASKDLASDSNFRVQTDLINSATEGNQNWWLRRVNNAQIEAPFNPALFWMCNIGRGGGLNSLGETYHRAYWRKWAQLLDPSDEAHNLLVELDFFFQDDVHARMQTPMSINNGAVTVTDPDIDDNGVADSITDFSAGPNAGCRKWCEGHLDSKAACLEFTGKGWWANNSGFSSDYTGGGVSPPLPMSGHPTYGRLTWGLQESVEFSGLGINKSASSGASATYSYTGGGSLNLACRKLAIHQRMLHADALSPGGRACVVVHSNAIDREGPPTVADYELARFVLALSLLHERCGSSLGINASKALSLDESLLELGAPLAARSMGTLNESNASFNLRAANYGPGNARFYWAEFAKGAVILRGDSPSVGLYPSADAAVPMALNGVQGPAPGAGMKWQRINANSYTNPLTGRSMRNQQPTLNNGADATSVSLRPYHAIFLRRVPV